jgi:hypothetical protein
MARLVGSGIGLDSGNGTSGNRTSVGAGRSDLTAHLEGIAASRGSLFTETLVPLGKHMEFKPILDVRKAELINRDWIVSRRRNRNLFDFVLMLRKFVVVHEEDHNVGTSSHMDDWEE